MKSQKSLASSSSNSQTPEALGIRASEEIWRETTRAVSQNESAFSTKKSRSRSLKKAADQSLAYSKFGIQVPSTNKDARKS